MKFTWEKTCSGYPEQYDVFDENGEQIAYVRLRYGYLKVCVPNCRGQIIYDYTFSNPKDEFKGEFYTEVERKMFIQTMEIELTKYLNKRK